MEYALSESNSFSSNERYVGKKESDFLIGFLTFLRGL